MLTGANPNAMSICSQCFGAFPTQSALANHLVWHNQIRGIQGSQGQAPLPPPLQPNRVTGFHPPSPPPIPTAPTPFLAPGIVEHFDGVKGFGFIRRTTLGAPSAQVYFNRWALAGFPMAPKRGQAVMFAEKQGPKGWNATIVQPLTSAANTTSSAPLPPEPVEEATIPAIVTSYKLEGGVGTVAKLDGSNSPDLYFLNSFCDIKRPPLTLGERVLIKEAVTKKGPTAIVVRRIAIPPETVEAAKSKSKNKKDKVTPPVLTNDLLLSALMRAMAMPGNSPQARDIASKAPLQCKETALSPPPTPIKKSPLKPQLYHDMIRNLSTSDGWDVYLPSAITMLARTQPVVAANVELIQDHETQSTTLIMALQDELHRAEHRVLLECSTDHECATDLNFGYNRLPSPVATNARTDPEPEPPRTKYCGICMEDTSIEDIFCVGGCDHTYCRTCIHPYIKSRIDQQDVTPRCPHGGCDVVLSDGDLTLVLTLEEQEEYYRKCQDLAVASVPGLFQCLQDDCRGIGALAADDPHFVCPLCRAERCVQCNTRQWHEGLTCEQLRQRERDNELHPEQLRQIYGNSSVYQCGSCAFGPIERAYCSDLATHHGERVGNAVINNGCPRCGWFANDISQWPAWNGQLHRPVN